METAAGQTGLAFRSEVFADRAYENDGTLRSRTKPGALLSDTQQSVRQVLQMIRQGTVTSFEGKEIPLRAQTVCIHGDGPHAVKFAKKIATELKKNGIKIYAE